MKTKFALVLSGGGFNGAFQLGALHYLNENWRAITGEKSPMHFDIISGVSAGALNGSFVAMNELSKLHDIWVNKIGKNGASEIYTSDFIDTDSQSDKLKYKFDIKQLASRLLSKMDLRFSITDKLKMLFSEQKRKAILRDLMAQAQDKVKDEISRFKSIATNEPLKEKLYKYLDRSKITNTIFTSGFVSLNTGSYHSVAHNEFVSNTDFIEAVLASTAIPFVWQPVDKISFEQQGQTVNAYNNVDGGVMNVSPLGDVVKRINDDTEICQYKIFVLNCHTGSPLYQDHSESSIGGLIARSFYELSLTEIFRNDLEQFLQINDLVKQVQKFAPSLVLKSSNSRPIKSFDTVIISPERGDELGNPLVANEKVISQRMAQGYNTAKKNIIF